MSEDTLAPEDAEAARRARERFDADIARAEKAHPDVLARWRRLNAGDPI